MSTFKRNEQSKQKENSYKVFFGNAEFDAIFQNNLMKGQIIVIEEDTPTTLYQQFLRQFVGAAYHSNQPIIIYDLNPEKWNKLIPTISNKKQHVQVKQQDNEQHNIAWRYSQMSMHFKLSNLNKEIPSLDLSKIHPNPQEILLRLNNLIQLPNLKSLINSIIDQYQMILKSSDDSGCKKLLIRGLFSPMLNMDLEHLGLFLHSLKVFCRSSHLLTVISVPSNCQYKNHFITKGDIYVQISQIFDNAQFSDFQGMLKIEKNGSFGSFKQIPIETDKWGIKILGKGSDIEIENLYETAVIEQDGDEKAKNPTKSVLCGSKPQDRIKLDF